MIWDLLVRVRSRPRVTIYSLKPTEVDLPNSFFSTWYIQCCLNPTCISIFMFLIYGMTQGHIHFNSAATFWPAAHYISFAFQNTNTHMQVHV